MLQRKDQQCADTTAGTGADTATYKVPASSCRRQQCWDSCRAPDSEAIKLQPTTTCQADGEWGDNILTQTMYIVRCRETERLYICYRLQFHKSSNKTQITSNRERNPPRILYTSACTHEILLCRTMHSSGAHNATMGSNSCATKFPLRWLSPQGVKVMMLVPLAELDHASVRLVRKAHIEGLGVRAEC